MAKLKVLHIYKTYLPETTGGAEQVIRQLSIAASAQGIRSDVLTLTNQPSQLIRYEGQLIYAAHRSLKIASTDLSIQAFSLFKRVSQNYDLLHFHYPWPFGDLLSLTLARHKPTLLTYHSDIVRQKTLSKLYRPLQTRFLNSVDHIVATSNNYLKTSETLQPYRSKTSVIPIGIDKAHYPTATTTQLNFWRNRFKEPFFFFVGVLRYYKGLHILLEAIKESNLNVVIAGSGPEEKALKQQAAALNLNNVHFIGQISDVDKSALFTLCTAVIFPSHLRSEAFGVTLLEGAMHGKPLISCEIGTGTSYINQHGITGIVIPPTDPIALNSAMQQLINNKQLCLKMGANSHNRYQTEFTAEKMATGYKELYQKIIGI